MGNMGNCLNPSGQTVNPPDKNDPNALQKKPGAKIGLKTT